MWLHNSIMDITQPFHVIKMFVQFEINLFVFCFNFLPTLIVQISSKKVWVQHYCDIKGNLKTNEMKINKNKGKDPFTLGY